MSGAFTVITKIDDSDIQRVLGRLQKKAGNLHPCLKNIGLHLEESTKQRFSKEEDPAGIHWAALKSSTLKRKKNLKTLTESADLRDSIISAVRNNGLRVGTNKAYAATHQFGRDKMPEHKRTVTSVYGNKLKFPVWAQVKSYNPKIPARPFLGISTTDREEILVLVQHYLKEK
ncbi:MAG TPA: phage virion morphogenesis protein [Desulfuromonadaceae bacterium]|jgi:phage virion morphogenesis protein